MLVALLLAACTAPAPDPEPRPFADPWEAGPWAVGVTTRRFVDDRGKELVAEVWYPAIVPADTPPDPYEELPLILDARRDALPARDHAPWPMVAFSHGFGGIRWQSAFLTEHLASHGFVVVAPDHAGSTFVDFDADALVEVAAERPGDVASSVDHVLAAAKNPADLLRGLTADAGYGMVGHSFGGFTSLIAGGGILDPAHAKTWCATHDAAGCAFFEDLELVDMSAAVPDPRVVATVPICPGGWYAFGPDGEGLQEVAEPLVLAGDLDADLPYDEENRPTWESLGAPKRLLTLHGAGHWGFTDLCRFTPSLLDCSGAVGGFMEPERVRAVTSAAVTAYLGVHLLGDARYAPYVEASAFDGEDDLLFEEADPTRRRPGPRR